VPRRAVPRRAVPRRAVPRRAVPRRGSVAAVSPARRRARYLLASPRLPQRP